jgi:hypothetical protein
MSQTPPEPEDLRYAIERFTVDAQRWQDNATTLRDASASAASITVDPLAFGPATWRNPLPGWKASPRSCSGRLTGSAGR